MKGSGVQSLGYLFGVLPILLSSPCVGEPARTVNDIELGPAEEFSSLGPVTVCMREMVIRAREGQSVQLLYSGIHNGTLRLTRADGKYVDFTDGEIFRDQRRRGQRPVVVRNDLQIFLVDKRDFGMTYQIEGRGRETEDYSPPRVMVKGSALSKGRADYPILEAISFEDSETAKCDRRYAYGWGVLLEGDPVMIDRADTSVKQEN